MKKYKIYGILFVEVNLQILSTPKELESIFHDRLEHIITDDKILNKTEIRKKT